MEVTKGIHKVDGNCEVIGNAMEITKGIHRVDGVNANCYIVGDKDLTLIDTGMPNNGDAILRYIKGMGREPHDVKTIIITHSHIDHIGSLSAVKEATGAKVAVHRSEALILSGKEQMPMPKGAMAVLIKAVGTIMKAPPVQPDALLDDGSDISGLLVMHTPGHTPGSIALLDKKRRAIFVGDTLRVGKDGVEGPPERFTLDPELAKKSMQRIASLDFDTMLSGHGEPLMPRAAEKVREFLKTN